MLTRQKEQIVSIQLCITKTCPQRSKSDPFLLGARESAPGALILISYQENIYYLSRKYLPFNKEVPIYHSLAPHLPLAPPKLSQKKSLRNQIRAGTPIGMKKSR
jgi:hypothetical protein